MKSRKNTEGRRLLLGLVAKSSRAEVAKIAGIPIGLFGHYLTGFALPSLKRAIVLERKLAVPCAAWDIQASLPTALGGVSENDSAPPLATVTRCAKTS